jgi:hypothetical protein
MIPTVPKLPDFAAEQDPEVSCQIVSEENLLGE